MVESITLNFLKVLVEPFLLTTFFANGTSMYLILMRFQCFPSLLHVVDYPILALLERHYIEVNWLPVTMPTCPPLDLEILASGCLKPVQLLGAIPVSSPTHA